MDNESSEPIEEKKQKLKGLIEKLHKGESADQVKAEFKNVIDTVTPDQIARIEEELIEEGLPREEIQKLCDVHIALFKESLPQKISVPAGHPIHILTEEHAKLLEYAQKTRSLAGEMKAQKDSEVEDAVAELKHLITHFKESESHYIREENVLFPYLERHGVTQPPAIMWSEHNSIREIEKKFYQLLEKPIKDFVQFSEELDEISTSLADMLSSHFFKENSILFPTALRVIKEEEWSQIRQQFDELGYCCFSPQVDFSGQPTQSSPQLVQSEDITFEMGTLSVQELKAVMDALPVDITLVDKKDEVKYFNQSGERIFPRTKAVIGRKVQQCHPQKSLHVVNQILDQFKKGKKDAAEFWIDLKGQLIYIRYFAVRDKEGEYLGCLEVTQDITDIQKITGERRLLSWS